MGTTDKHIAPIEWVFGKTMESSVRKHTKYIKVPDTINLQEKKLGRKFYAAYTKACQTCHGAPGRKSDTWMFIYPAAPDLTIRQLLENGRMLNFSGLSKMELKIQVCLGLAQHMKMKKCGELQLS